MNFKLEKLSNKVKQIKVSDENITTRMLFFEEFVNKVSVDGVYYFDELEFVSKMSFESKKDFFTFYDCFLESRFIEVEAKKAKIIVTLENSKYFFSVKFNFKEIEKISFYDPSIDNNEEKILILQEIWNDLYRAIKEH